MKINNYELILNDELNIITINNKYTGYICHSIINNEYSSIQTYGFEKKINLVKDLIFNKSSLVKIIINHYFIYNEYEYLELIIYDEFTDLVRMNFYCF